MPDNDDTTTQADGGGGGQDQGARLDRLEGKLDTLAAAVARLVPGSHSDAQGREERRLDRPSTVEEQVQAELARRDKQAQEEADRTASQTHRETTEQRLAKLEERPPAEPRSRAKRLGTGWG